VLNCGGAFGMRPVGQGQGGRRQLQGLGNVNNEK